MLLLLLSILSEAVTAGNRTTNDTTNSLLLEEDNTNYDCSQKIKQLGGIPSRDVKRSAVAARLAQLVGDLSKVDDISERNYLAEAYGFTNGRYYESGVDAVYVAKIVGIHNDYCAASFRGTTSTQPADWATNLKMGPVPFGFNDANSKCDMHEGYHQAYTEFEYRTNVEEFLDNCMADCPNCEVILTGHSQGGGIAEIAALYLKEMDMNRNNSTTMDFYVITIGAVPSLGAGCKQLLTVEERCRWYRYVMAREGTAGRSIVYDPVPSVFSRSLDPPNKYNEEEESDDGNDNIVLAQSYARNGGLGFMGHEIILSADYPSASYYVGFDQHHYVELSKMDVTGQAHYDTLYTNILERQDELYNTNNDGILGDYLDNNGAAEDVSPTSFLPTTGFPVGSVCNPDEEICIVGTVCQKEEDGWLWGNWRNTCQQQAQTEQHQLTAVTENLLTTSTTIVDSSSSPNTQQGIWTVRYRWLWQLVVILAIPL